MLGTIITSRTRILLLLTFFSNVRNTGFLRGLAEEFGDSTNSVRTELLRLADAGLILSRDNGRRRYYRANPRHPLFPELRNLVHKSLGLDKVREVLSTRSDLQLVLVIDAYARGRDSGTIELMIIGRDEPLDLDGLVTKAEEVSGRAIRTFLFSEKQFLELRRSLRLDHVLVLREDDGAAEKLLEKFRDPRWEGDEAWRKDIRWMTDTMERAESQLESVPRPSDRGPEPSESENGGVPAQSEAGNAQGSQLSDSESHLESVPRPSDRGPEPSKYEPEPSKYENDGGPDACGPGNEDAPRVSEPESDGESGELGGAGDSGNSGNTSNGKKKNGRPGASKTRRKKHHFF